MGLPVKELMDLTKIIGHLKDSEVVANVRIFKKGKVIAEVKFTPELLNFIRQIAELNQKLPF